MNFSRYCDHLDKCPECLQTAFLQVVTDPNFKLFGLTKQDILRVVITMKKWAVSDVAQVLKEDPKGTRAARYPGSKQKDDSA